MISQRGFTGFCLWGGSRHRGLPMGRATCGQATVDGSPCMNGPGCRADHPPAAGSVPGRSTAAGIGPGADPLAAVGPAFVDPRDPAATVADLDDVSLAYAAGKFGVEVTPGPGWRAEAVDALEAKVEAMAPLDWRPVAVPWHGYWDRDSSAGTFVFALDPDVVGDNPVESFRSALAAAGIAHAMEDPYQARMQESFNWGELAFDHAGGYGVMMQQTDDLSAPELPAGRPIMLDEVDHDETLLDFNDEDSLAEQIDGFRDRWPELADRARMEFCPGVVAADPSTRPEVLAQLASHPERHVRDAVARNSGAPAAVRAQAALLSDG